MEELEARQGSCSSSMSWQTMGESVLLSPRMWVFTQPLLSSTLLSVSELSSMTTLLALSRLSRTDAVSFLRRRWPHLPSQLIRMTKNELHVEQAWLIFDLLANLLEDGCSSRELQMSFLENKDKTYRCQWQATSLKYAKELSGEFESLVTSSMSSSFPLMRQKSSSASSIMSNARSAVHRTLDAAVLLGVPVVLQTRDEAAQVASWHLLQALASRQDRVEHSNLFRLRAEAIADIKTLMGSYVCTCVPGQFEWRDGIVKRALKSGHWLIIEAFDQSSSDVASYISDLIDNHLHDDDNVSPNFRLFVVVSRSNSHFSCSSKALKLAVDGYNESEIATEASHSCPLLKSVIPRFIGCLKEVNMLSLDNVITWCRRVLVDQGVDESGEQRLKRSVLLRQAHQVVVASASSDEQRERRLRAIENNFYVKTSDIETALSNDISNLRSSSESSSFFMTRQSSELLSFLSTSVSASQPVLLIGETGVGKTSAIQYLSEVLGIDELVVLNLSPQSDPSDLVGGFKPVNPSVFYEQMLVKFRCLLKQSFDQERNRGFVARVADVFRRQRWSDLLKIIAHVTSKALQIEQRADVRSEWSKLLDECRLISDVFQGGDKGRNLFSFVIGPICQAMMKGQWVLLDEVNLAETELLAVLDTILVAMTSNVYYVEGNDESIVVHPKFRLFAAMNPATDVGKRDLESRLKNRFVQFNVVEPTSTTDLESIVGGYLRHVSDSVVFNVVKFYRMARLLRTKRLTNGQGGRPSFSLRTLCRALKMCMRNVHEMGLKRALLEAMSASFLTQLDHDHSYALMLSLLHRHFYQPDLLRPLAAPSDCQRPHVAVEGFHIGCGPRGVVERADFILTSSVRQNLKDVARIVAMSSTAVLLQGDTSVGKTSLVRYLADVTGHLCIRINNHEHTELDEYIGAYCTSEEGKFVFIEGLVVKAMREGHWLILDELNLAPSEVLESLNRVLDENRELYINETQTLVKAHPDFRVFATQNPAHYGGRKMLSRAFRSRFIELHFDNLPTKELKTIVEHKCGIPPKLSSKMIATMSELQLKRRSSAAFQGRSGFITLRDLFRWAIRYEEHHLEFGHQENENNQSNDIACKDTKRRKLEKRVEQQRRKTCETNFFDYDQHMLEEGFLVLASRLRADEETLVVKETLEKIFRRKLDLKKLFSLTDPTATLAEEMRLLRLGNVSSNELIWTEAATRMAALILHSFKYKEPVLLVGNTGLGKTSIASAVAHMLHLGLHSISCHLNCDASDFLGGLRPIRWSEGQRKDNKLFEWVDGPLIEAMRKGEVLMIDEIALAEDSVLERLNSVLETDRTMVVAERPDDHLIVANENFKVVATMNPGGDYGKRELSVALRNRFSEIWCPQTLKDEELESIFRRGLGLHKSSQDEEESNDQLAQMMTDFLSWASSNLEGFQFSLRDVRNWAAFIARAKSNCRIRDDEAFIHGVKLVFFDAFEPSKKQEQLVESQKFLSNRMRLQSTLDLDDTTIVSSLEYNERCESNTAISMGPFVLEKKQVVCSTPSLSGSSSAFLLDSPSGRVNVLKVLRGLVISKPVLLEGPPGIGKTALVSTLASQSNNGLVRINLSEESEVSDLFGCDLPSTDDESVNLFGWQDGPFLRALRNGHWILLDELNLASQTVLEGLNACFDHRGEIYVPELNRTFHIDNRCSRIFATQNPAHQGHGRKSLPRSFLNRFTRIQLDELHRDDAVAILDHKFNNNNTRKQSIPVSVLKDMVDVVDHLDKTVNVRKEFGCNGFSFNLRDLIRWTEAVVSKNDDEDNNDEALIRRVIVNGRLVLAERFRSEDAKLASFQMIRAKFDLKNAFNDSYMTSIPDFRLSEQYLKIGQCKLRRSMRRPSPKHNALVLSEQLAVLEHLMLCISHSWIPVLVGSKGVGKSAVIDILATFLGQNPCILSLNASTDSSELLGSFEQINAEQRLLHHLKTMVRRLDDIIVNEKCLDIVEVLVNTRSGLSRLLRREGEKSARPISDNEVERRVRGVTELISGLNHALSTLKTVAKLSTLDLISELTNALSELDSITKGNSFEWCDSPLVRAVVEGEWLVLDNANFCSVSMLDRLNSLLEPNGSLVIGEQGAHNGEMRVVKPHPNFRVFLTVDPANGELSAAMRNRCVELYMTSTLSTKVVSKVLRGDLYSVLGSQRDLLKSLLSSSRLSSLHQTRSFTANLTMMLEAGHELNKETIELIKQCGSLDHSDVFNNVNVLSESCVARVRHLATCASVVIPYLQCHLMLHLIEQGVNPLLCVHSFLEDCIKEDVDIRLTLVKDNLVKDAELMESLSEVVNNSSFSSSTLLRHLTVSQVRSIDSEMALKSQQLITTLNDDCLNSKHWLHVFRVCVLCIALKDLLLIHKKLRLPLGVTWSNISESLVKDNELKPFLKAVEVIMETNSAVSVMQKSVLNFTKLFTLPKDINVVKVINESNQQQVYDSVTVSDVLMIATKNRALVTQGVLPQVEVQPGVELQVLQVLLEDLATTSVWLRACESNKVSLAALTHVSGSMSLHHLRHVCGHDRNRASGTMASQALLRAHQRRMSATTQRLLEPQRSVQSTVLGTASFLMERLVTTERSLSIDDFERFMATLKCFLINMESVVEDEKTCLIHNKMDIKDKEGDAGLISDILASSIKWLRSQAELDPCWSLLSNLLRDVEVSEQFSSANGRAIRRWHAAVKRAIRGFALFHALRTVANMDVLIVWKATKDFLETESDLFSMASLTMATTATLNVSDTEVVLKDNRRHEKLRHLRIQMEAKLSKLMRPDWERLESRDEFIQTLENVAQSDMEVNNFVDIVVQLLQRTHETDELKLRLDSLTTNLAVDMEMLSKKFVSHSETSDFIVFSLAETLVGLIDMYEASLATRNNLDDIVEAMHHRLIDKQHSYLDMTFQNGIVQRGQLRLPDQAGVPRVDADALLDLLRLQTKELEANSKMALPTSLALTDMELKWKKKCEDISSTLLLLSDLKGNSKANTSRLSSTKTSSLNSSMDTFTTLLALSSKMRRSTALRTLGIGSRLLKFMESELMTSSEFLVRFKRSLERSKTKMEDLLNIYPSEFKLMEAKSIVEKVLEHRVTDSRTSFQNNLEQCLALMEDWNLRAKKSLKLDTTAFLLDILEKWNKMDANHMMKIKSHLKAHFNSLIPSMIALVLLVIDRLVDDKESKRRNNMDLLAMYINVALNLFLFSSSPLDHKDRVAALTKVAEVLGKEHLACKLIDRNLSYFNVFNLDDTSKQILTNAQSLVVDMKRSLKEVALKKDKGQKRDNEEKVMKKFYSSIVDLLSKPFEQKTVKVINTHVFDHDTNDAKSSKVMKDTTKVVFKKRLRESLDTFNTLAKSIMMNEEEEEEKDMNTIDVDTMTSSLEALSSQLSSSSGLTSKERYPMHKLLESHLKSLSMYYSHRKGNLYDLRLVRTLAVVEVRDKRLLAALAQLDLLIDVMAQFCTQQKSFLSKGFLERCTGLSRAVMVDLMHLDNSITRVDEMVKHTMDNIQSFQPSYESKLRIQLLKKECIIMMREVKKMDNDLDVEGVISSFEDNNTTNESLSNSLKSLQSKAMSSESQQMITTVCEHVDKMNVWETQLSKKINLDTILESKVKANLDSCARKCSKETRKLLQGLNNVLEDQPMSWQLIGLVSEQLESFLSLTTMQAEVSDLMMVCEYLNLDQITFDTLTAKLLKHLDMWQHVLESVSKWVHKLLSMHTLFLFRFMQSISLFVSYEFIEGEENDNEEEQKDGCGLGDGADGDSKAINEENVTDDLLENLDLKTNQESKDDKEKDNDNDDAYDCPRERIEGDNERMNDDEDENNDEDDEDQEDDEDMPDVERAEGQVELDEEDEIKPDNKEDEDEDEEEDKDEGDNANEDDEQKVDRPEDDENEMRKREKDEDVMSPEVQTGDTEHEEHDEDIDDLEDIPENQNLDDNDDEDEDMEQNVDEIERRPDFASSSSEDDDDDDDDDQASDPTEIQSMDNEEEVEEENKEDADAKVEESKPDDSEGQHGGNTEDVAMEDETDVEDNGQKHEKAVKEERTTGGQKANAMEENEENEKGDDGEVEHEEREAAEVQKTFEKVERLTLVQKNESTMDDDQSNVYAHSEQQRGEDAPETKMAMDTLKTYDDDKEENNDEEAVDEAKEDASDEVNEDNEMEVEPSATTDNECKETLVYKGSEAMNMKMTEMVARGDLISELKSCSNSESLSVDAHNYEGELPMRMTETSSESLTKWSSLCERTSSMTSSLSEQLRLILEPTKRTRFKGDYKSGKRLNMKRIIGYLASDMRKDKIWMRRQKPSKRDTSIVVAVDDSSSMQENEVQQLTFEALATLCNALSKVEVGELGVVSFGREAQVVCELRKVFDSNDGARIVSAFGFDQSETRLVDMLSLCKGMLSRKEGKKIVFVLSDGRGVFHEGKERVMEAVTAMEDVMVVYIIIESPNVKESVLDIRTTVFDSDNKLVGINNYMANFPFELYIVLRQLHNLPQVLADALRQWFEIVME